MIRGVHHINYLVRDLAEARGRMARLLGTPFDEAVELRERGALTARARLGNCWFVLVQPTRKDSVPGRYLTERGEGLFLLSLDVADLADERNAAASRGATFSAAGVREGLDGWRILDFDAAQTPGLELQLCEDPEPAI